MIEVNGQVGHKTKVSNAKCCHWRLAQWKHVVWCDESFYNLACWLTNHSLAGCLENSAAWVPTIKFGGGGLMVWVHLSWFRLSCLVPVRWISSWSSLTFGMNWNADGVPGLIHQHQCPRLTNAPVAEWEQNPPSQAFKIPLEAFRVEAVNSVLKGVHIPLTKQRRLQYIPMQDTTYNVWIFTDWASLSSSFPSHSPARSYYELGDSHYRLSRPL